MNTDVLTKQALDGVQKYFKVLESTGYMKYGNVNTLLGLFLVDDFLNTDMNMFITEDDYRIMDKFLYCLYGHSCLLPYSVYTNRMNHLGGILPRNSYDNTRVDEDKTLRHSEEGNVRYVNDSVS